MFQGPVGPYAPPRYEAYGQPKRSSKTVWYVLGGIAALLVVGVIALAVWGMSLVEEEVSFILEKHPAVVKALGPNPDCEMDLKRSMNDERYDWFYYRCSGPSGKGVAVVHTESTGPNAEEELVEGTLELDDGRKIKLDVER